MVLEIIRQVRSVTDLLRLIAGLGATLFLYGLGQKLYKRTKLSLLSPNIFTMAGLILILVLFKIPHSSYEPAGQLISFFLKPSIVVLALPLYRKLPKLMDNKAAVLAGVLAGTLASALSIIGLSLLFSFDHQVLLSLLPKSITTPMGIEVSRTLGGLIPLTVFSILITGVLGVILAPLLLSFFRVHLPLAKGVAMGSSSHVLGTSKAMEMGETEGALSSLALTLTGLVSVFFLPLLSRLVQLFL